MNPAREPSYAPVPVNGRRCGRDRAGRTRHDGRSPGPGPLGAHAAGPPSRSWFATSADLIAEHAGQLAEASASARLRPTLESLTAEVLPLAEACRFLEREAGKLLAPLRLGKRGLPLWLAGVRSEIQREPFGVVLIIGPGNYPLLLPGVQLIQALVAGNAVLLKPGVGGTDRGPSIVRLDRPRRIRSATRRFAARISGSGSRCHCRAPGQSFVHRLGGHG